MQRERLARPIASASDVGAAVVEQHEVELAAGRRPCATPVHSDVYGFIRSAGGRSAAAAAGRPRGRRQRGQHLLDPHDRDQHVAAASVHIRPLPSDSTTTIVPVSATAKLAPLTADLGRRKLLPQVRPGRLGQRARLVGEVGSTPIARRKRSRISARFLWIAGTRMCDGRSRRRAGRSAPPRSVSIALDAGRCERLVEPDLVGRHGLDLDDLAGAVACDELGDDLVRLVGVARPVDVAAGRLDRRLELRAAVVEVRERRRSLIARPASRRPSQSGTSPTTPRRLSRIVEVALPRLRRSCVSARATRAASSNRIAGLVGIGSWLVGAVSVEARISARWSVPPRPAGACRPPPMCIRHEVSAAVQTSRPRVEHGAAACRSASRSTCPRS